MIRRADNLIYEEKDMIKYSLVIAMVGILSFFASVISAAESTSALPAAGKKCIINDEFYFTYEFDKKPQLGTVIVKIELYNREGKRDSSMKIQGESRMPAMKGAHDSGPVAFQLNKKGDYLMPVNVVMPGEWEVNLDFIEKDKTIFSGRIQFKI